MMAIGTSTGSYFTDALHFHMNPYLRDPESTPDNNEESDQELVDKKAYTPTYWRVNDFHSFRPSDDVEDRRNYGIMDELGTISMGQIKDKASAILENPAPGTAMQTLTARIPTIETPLGDDLGLKDLKEP